MKDYTYIILYFTFYFRLKGNIRKYHSTTNLALLNSNEKNTIIFDRIRYLITEKSNLSDAYSHEYTKIKINSDDDLPLEKH